jgi:hypothetical protein
MDYALYGKPTQDWFALFKHIFSTPAAVGIQGGTDYTKPPMPPTSSLHNDAYIGTYTNDFFGDIAVIEHDGALAIVEGPNNMTFALKHYDRDIFTYETEGENVVGTTGVYFTIGTDGKATSVRVENLDVNNSGSFTRVVKGTQ